MRTQLGPGRFVPRMEMTATTYGRLKSLPGAGRDVRSECTNCGTHVLLAPSPLGRLHGLCPVCGGDSFTMVTEVPPPGSSITPIRR
jgi:ribosomal protein S27AE